MAAIIQAIFDEVEHLFERARLPSVDSLRPKSCPLCGQLARVAGKPLGIVGHGTYCRQVLGLIEAVVEATTLVRRYLCRGCPHTISVLSDYLHPRRWYAAIVILEALRLHLVDSESEATVRRQFNGQASEGSWRSLRRWRRGLLVVLWSWLGKRLGATTPATTRREGRLRVVALLAEAILGSARDPPTAARALGNSTVHFQGVSWLLDHDPPEDVRQKFRSK
ncbi:MAG: hypothetical protein V3T64_01025 [Myxococcota bacterium]